VANENQAKHLVAVIGAGPAGIYAARQLAASGAQVVLLNRDINPAGWRSTASITTNTK